ncbi:hypothetical protein DPMN_120859 [Dreissena polymorpha]|uniref:Uncharacterized protein n=1 Tax=Dreissena polymorpha TaxID=45954 RepID=A0A9D4JNZ1_DREPO|nr:hypothetical protein DPMN_120859 [Dreissena polymorpha]
METFHRECQRWKFRCEQTQIPSALSLETMLLALPEDMYPNVAERRKTTTGEAWSGVITPKKG